MIIEAPQAVRDQIVDRMIEEVLPRTLVRWVLEMDQCRIDFRNLECVCECGEYWGATA
jgi:hypothetical protein